LGADLGRLGFLCGTGERAENPRHEGTSHERPMSHAGQLVSRGVEIGRLLTVMTVTSSGNLEDVITQQLEVRACLPECQELMITHGGEGCECGDRARGRGEPPRAGGRSSDRAGSGCPVAMTYRDA